MVEDYTEKQMIRLKITNEQIEYATYLVNNCNYGRRGKFDGDKSKQLVGMLAQTVLADYLKQPRTTLPFGSVTTNEQG